jgi:hypothetical protein
MATSIGASSCGERSPGLAAQDRLKGLQIRFVRRAQNFGSLHDQARLDERVLVFTMR